MAEIHQINALFFFENLGHQNVILKLTDLYYMRADFEETPILSVRT